MFTTTLKAIRDRKMDEAEKEGGFTLIELLVVVVIIGILVAIAIPLYLNYRDGANEKSVESDVRNAAPAVEQYYADNNAYPADNTAFQGITSIHKSGSNTLTYKVVGSGYSIEGNGSGKFCYQSSTGKVASGACP